MYHFVAPPKKRLMTNLLLDAAYPKIMSKTHERQLKVHWDFQFYKYFLEEVFEMMI